MLRTTGGRFVFWQAIGIESKTLIRTTKNTWTIFVNFMIPLLYSYTASWLGTIMFFNNKILDI